MTDVDAISINPVRRALADEWFEYRLVLVRQIHTCWTLPSDAAYHPIMRWLVGTSFGQEPLFLTSFTPTHGSRSLRKLR